MLWQVENVKIVIIGKVEQLIQKQIAMKPEDTKDIMTNVIVENCIKTKKMV